MTRHNAEVDRDVLAAAGERLDYEAAIRLLGAIAGQRVVVVGDIFLDEYLIGRAERLSREGPVPVLAFERRIMLPGGAANPSRNVSALGAAALQIGLVGADAAAAELIASLLAAGIDTAGVVVDAERPTTVKKRIVVAGMSVPQQLARIDIQSRATVAGDTESALIDALRSAAVGADAVLVSHYKSGVVSANVVRAAREAARAAGAVLSADAQGDLELFEGFDLVRIGRGDAAASLDQPLERDQDFAAAGAMLRERLGCGAIIFGRGAEGTSVVDEIGHSVLQPTNVTEVFDVSGAGDTIIAVVTLGLAAGAPLRTAVGLANRSAGLVVRRLGVAAPSAAELLATFEGG